MPSIASTQFVATAIQMVSGSNVAENLQVADNLINKAVRQQAQLVVLPECFGLMNLTNCQTPYSENIADGHIQQALSRIAQHHGIWLVGGTLPIKSHHTELVRNSTLLFAPDGSVACRYDKIHLFCLSKQAESYCEANTFEPGVKGVTFQTPLARLAFGICYDIRFPELFRQLLPFDILVIPAAFIAVTGKAHWEVLLRARAIENQCYLIAADQGGIHENGRVTHGYSMIIDPWGRILAKQATGQGCISATIDLDYLKDVRRKLPALKNRVF
ncbi:MAG: carbon-nitrogen hydrolase family protein [Neisseriales bacterium]|nr:MAG: carbon-nitrogen hydrolase family protein [Neisseriales bacterium]